MALRRENIIVGVLLMVIGVFLGGIIGTTLIIIGIVTVITSFL